MAQPFGDEESKANKTSKDTWDTKLLSLLKSLSLQPLVRVPEGAPTIKKWILLGVRAVQVAFGIGWTAFLGAFLLNMVIPWIIDTVSPWVTHPEKANQNWPFKVFICGTVVTVGGFLFWIRGRYPKVYGLGEIGFALATAYASLSKFSTDEPLLVWFGLFGSAYLVVRGIDNYTKKQVSSK